jgi:hypothetical protein
MRRLVRNLWRLPQVTATDDDFERGGRACVSAPFSSLSSRTPPSLPSCSVALVFVVATNNFLIGAADA